MIQESNQNKENPAPHTWESHHPKRISFILPTKNRGAILERTLAQLRTVITARDELIIIDGGSKDSTCEVVERNRDLVNIFVSEPDQPGEANNKGIILSRGKFVFFLNDDDIVHPSELEKAIHVLDEHPDIDVLYCGGTVYFHSQPKKASFIYVPQGIQYGKEVEDVFRYGACSAATVIRRHVFPITGMFDPMHPWVCDSEFIMRCIKEKMKVRFCRINLFEHRVTDISASHTKKTEVYRDKIALARKYCGKIFFILYLLKKAPWSRRLKISGIASALLDLHERVGQNGMRGFFMPRRSFSPPVWDGGFS